jgi:hypothetical protein
MPPKQGEHIMDRTLRWMKENLEGAYEAVHPPDHCHAGGFRTNSGTCIIACCYIESLGKVLYKGSPPRDKKLRLSKFLECCMPDFIAESDHKQFPATPAKGPKTGVHWLYHFRCSFVHAHYPEYGSWGRYGKTGDYWCRVDPAGVTLNIDRLVEGFLKGIEKFEQFALKDPDLRERFLEYIRK